MSSQMSSLNGLRMHSTATGECKNTPRKDDWVDKQDSYIYHSPKYDKIPSIAEEN